MTERGDTCTCDRGPSRPDVLFTLYTAVPERRRFVTTIWAKYDSPDNARRLFGTAPRRARTLVMPLGKQRCPACGGWRYVGKPARDFSRTIVAGGTVEADEASRYPAAAEVWEFEMTYDPDRCTEGGLAEAHEHFVAQVRAGLPLGWGEEVQTWPS